jgi:NAD(P)-dependent dehydrogenase (short-subunit alcohol dehydrogenase family)
MKGRLCIVTGANSGIGYQTAKGLAEKQATVVMVCRDQEKGEKAREEIKVATGSNSLYHMHCDVSSMKSIDRFTREFQNRFTCLHVLINNAGAAFSKRQTTEEGYEKPHQHPQLNISPQMRSQPTHQRRNPKTVNKPRRTLHEAPSLLQSNHR